MYSPIYYNPIQYVIQDCIDYFLDFFFELPEFDVNDIEYEQTEPISYYKKSDSDDDEFIKIIII